MTAKQVKKWIYSPLLGLALLGPAPAGAQGLDAITRNPAAFDQRAVTVTGTVTMVEAGGAFVLLDGASTVRVIWRGGPPVHPGDRVEVHGVFRFAGGEIQALMVSFR